MSKTSIQIIQGGISEDQRGQIRYVNGFDMTLVKRFYIIKNSDTDLVRGWRGHRIEQRWFYALSGGFSIDLVQIDNWENASPDLTIETRCLKEGSQQILHVPAGYGTALRALHPDSQLLVFADRNIEHAVNDDYTWPIDYFVRRPL